MAKLPGWEESNPLSFYPSGCIRIRIYGSFLSSAAEAVNRWAIQNAERRMSLPRRRSNVSNEPENFCERSPETLFLVDGSSLEHVRSSSGAKSCLLGA
jgi:hypothetical protein